MHEFKSKIREIITKFPKSRNLHFINVAFMNTFTYQECDTIVLKKNK